MRKKMLTILCLVLVVAWLSGCATTQTTKKPYRLSPQGTVIWEDEFEFLPPPPDWKLLRVEAGENDINFGFMRSDPGPFPSVTTFAYDEDPFGCTQHRSRGGKGNFLRDSFSMRFLQFQILKREKGSGRWWRRACGDRRRERTQSKRRRSGPKWFSGNGVIG